MGKNAKYMNGWKKRHGECYSDRTHHGFYTKPRKTVCPHCAKIMRASNGLCPKCKTKLITISFRAKLPKKNAPFSKWKKFWEAHNEWCNKRPYFKDQIVSTVMDYRTCTLHIDYNYIPPASIEKIDLKVVIDSCTGLQECEVLSKVKNDYSTG